MLTALARFFRISLSKGSNIIPIGDEIEHARNYLTIQKMRYKNKFSADISVEPGVEKLYTIKLIIQPILENAINYGVSGLDDSGEIKITGKLEGERIILAVEDNGIGMPKEEADLLLTDSQRVQKKGSGVGLVNVKNRIQILFGKAYGLVIESEPDEGTTVFVHLPAVPYTEENRTILEQGRAIFAEEENENKTKNRKDEKQ